MRRVSHYSDLWNKGTSPAEAVALAGSPHTYTASRSGVLLVSAGTVSLLQYSRLSTLYDLGLIAGQIQIVKGDAIVLTYLVAPTVTFIPA